MAACNDFRVTALRYLDGDLEKRELEVFRAHLADCAECRTHLSQEQQLSDLLHRSRPLYSVPAALHARVVEDVREHDAERTTRHGSILAQWLGSSIAARWLPRWKILAPATLVMLLCLIVVPHMIRRVQAANYVNAAVATHRAYVSGTLPLGFQSDSPKKVTEWLASRLPFQFRLPDAESTVAGTPIYRLTGATLVNYKGHPAGLVTYKAQNQQISLLVASSKSAVVSGGNEVQLGRLAFHYNNQGQLNVITWSVHDLSYALVSSMSSGPRESCLVCHQNMTDRSTFTKRR
jgi:anti-sigma factor RsiW